MAPLCASPAESAAVINATVRMPLALHGQDDTFPAWKKRRTTTSPTHVSYEVATFSTSAHRRFVRSIVQTRRDSTPTRALQCANAM